MRNQREEVVIAKFGREQFLSVTNKLAFVSFELRVGVELVIHSLKGNHICGGVCWVEDIVEGDVIGTFESEKFDVSNMGGDDAKI